MKKIQLIMGMPITIQIKDPQAKSSDFKAIFAFFRQIDRQFSPYKKSSEVSKINRKEIIPAQYSVEMHEILAMAEKTKRETRGYFDVYREGYLDPSGIVKGYAILKAVELLKSRGLTNFYIDAGGDVQVSGTNEGKKWRIGIRHPFEHEKTVKTLSVTTEGVATSGTYLRGEHIYDPTQKAKSIIDIVSMTVIGPTILQADLMATAAFAMGKKGIQFIEATSGLEGYMIDKDGVATFTTGLTTYA